MIRFGKTGNYLTPLADVVMLNYLSRWLVFTAELTYALCVCGCVCVCALCSDICKLFCEKGRLEIENGDVLGLSSDPDQTVTSPSTQGTLRDKMSCCYRSMALLQSSTLEVMY